MKKKLLCLLTVGILLAGCGKVPKLKDGKEAVVTFENGDKISVDELYEKIKKTYGLENLITLIDKYVLTESFPDYAKDAEKYAEEQIDTMRESYDTDAELENILMQFGFGSIDNYQDTLFNNYIKKYAETEYAKTQISDKEVEKFYKDSYEGDIEVSHILITADVTDEMAAEEITEAEEKAEKTAKKIIKELKKTKKKNLEKKFKELVKEYSEDEATIKDDGSLGRINQKTLDSNYDELVNAAYSIKDGEYYAEPIKTELGYHVILRTKSYEKSSLKKAKDNILDILAEDYISNETNISTKAMQYYRKELGMEIEDKELQKQYANYIQNQLFEK